MSSIPTSDDAVLQRVPRSLGGLIAGYKASVTRQINAARGTPDALVWQRNSYERIIRSERALDALRRYIENNPARWYLDRYTRAAVGHDPWAVELMRLLEDDRA